MLRDIVTAFIVGSSIPVVFLFFSGYYSYRGSYNLMGEFNSDGTAVQPIDTYFKYTLIAPLFFGTTSAIAIYLSKKYDITTRQAMAIVSIIASTIVSLYITYRDVYTWDQERITQQYFILFFSYAILHILIIATIYEYIRGDCGESQ
jgi:hypothetical protein